MFTGLIQTSITTLLLVLTNYTDTPFIQDILLYFLCLLKSFFKLISLIFIKQKKSDLVTHTLLESYELLDYELVIGV